MRTPALLCVFLLLTGCGVFGDREPDEQTATRQEAMRRACIANELSQKSDDELKTLQQTGAVVLAFTAADLGTVPLFRRLRGRAAKVLDSLAVSHELTSRSAALLASNPPVRDLRANLRWTAAFAAPYVAKRMRLTKRGECIGPKLTTLTKML